MFSGLTIKSKLIYIRNDHFWVPISANGVSLFFVEVWELTISLEVMENLPTECFNVCLKASFNDITRSLEVDSLRWSKTKIYNFLYPNFSSDCRSVWTDLAKFRNFGKKSLDLSSVFLIFCKIFNLDTLAYF